MLSQSLPLLRANEIKIIAIYNIYTFDLINNLSICLYGASEAQVSNNYFTDITNSKSYNVLHTDALKGIDEVLLPLFLLIECVEIRRQ